MTVGTADARETFGGGIAVITGAGAGIGAGLARHAHSLGMTLVLVDVDERAATALRDELVADAVRGTGAGEADPDDPGDPGGPGQRRQPRRLEGP